MIDTTKTTKLVGNELIVETKFGTEVYDSKFLVAALLIYVAKGSGTIEPEEVAKMIDLIEQHFQLEGAESLELLTRTMSELAEKPELAEQLVQFGRTLSDREKEDIAVMALKVIAADGRRHVSEMEQFNRAVEAVGVSPEIVHKAFDRYFEETMPPR
jgi:uncharacterized tellurite resistance protein B-like protein